MDVPDRVAEPLVLGLAGIGGEEREVLVDRARDDVEIEPLGRPRLLEHEERQALRRGVGQPLVDGEAVALRLRDLLAVLVEEELVVEALRRRAAERSADAARQLDRVDQVLARHLVVDAERRPAQRPVGLPLALDVAAGDRLLDQLAGVGIAVDDGAGVELALDDRHLQHGAGHRGDRQERRIGLAPLVAERRQHDRHHLVIGREHLQQRRVEAAGRVVVGGAGELVVRSRSGRGSGGAAHCCARRSSDTRRTGRGRAVSGWSRCARIISLFGHVVGHLAQPVHVVGEAEEPRRDRVAGQHPEGGPHHGGARDLAEGADMRQARRAVAGLEQDAARGIAALLEPRDDLPRLLERPGLRALGGLDEGRGDVDRRAGWPRSLSVDPEGMGADPRNAGRPRQRRVRLAALAFRQAGP